MNYEIIYSEDAEEFLGKLPNDINARIINKLADSKANPYHFFLRLEGRAEFRLRVGDYRVIADIDDSLKIIKVRLIGHRKNIYE